MVELYEKSAGGILYKKHNGIIEVLMLAWRNAKWDLEYVLPKGHIEEDESAYETAIREIAEETWLAMKDLELIKFMNKINYSFIATHKEGNPLINKDVYLFLVKYNGKKEPVPQKEERFVGYKWFTIDDLRTIRLKPDVVGFIEKNIQFM